MSSQQLKRNSSGSQGPPDGNAYLKRPVVMRFMDNVVSECLASQPDDPEGHILAYLAERRGVKLLAVGSTAVAPVPPSGAAPVVPWSRSPSQSQMHVQPQQPQQHGGGAEQRWNADVALEWTTTCVERLARLAVDGSESLAALPALPTDAKHPLTARLHTAIETLSRELLRNTRVSHSVISADPQKAEEAVSQALFEAAELSLGNLDETDVIERIVAASRKLLAADRCSVFVADEERRELHTIIEGRTFYLAYGQGIAGTVARTGCSLLINNAYEDPRFDSKIDQELGYITRDILCMPVQLDEKLIAVVQLVNKIDGTFTPADESLFASFAKFAAMRIVNSQLYREQQRLAMRNTMMAEVTESLANTELDESVLIPVIIKNAKAICGADRCAFFQVDEARQELVAHLEGVDDQLTMPIDRGIAGWCARHQQLLNVSSAYSDPRFNRDVDQVSGYHTVNILCIPIFVDRKIVAVSQLVNKMQPKKAAPNEDARAAELNPLIVPFTAEDEEVLSAFAAICGVCIRNCRLVESASRRQAVLESTLDVARTMVNSDVTKPQDVMVTITQSACRLANASRGILFMMDSEFTTLCAPNPDDASRAIEIPLGSGTIGRAAQLNRIQLMNCGANDPPDTTSFGACEARTVIACPIAVDSRVLGVVALANKHGGPGFTAEDSELVELFSVFAACVIRDARLFAMAQQEAEGWSSLMAIGRTRTDVVVGGDSGGSSGGALLLSRENSNTPSSAATESVSNPILPSASARLDMTTSTRDTINDVSSDEVRRFVALKPPPELVALLPSWDFNIHRFRDGLSDPDLLVALLLHAFRELDLIETCKLDETVLCRFILAIRSRYRNVPYHSFFHACDVTQTMFALLLRTGLAKSLPPHELLAALIAAIVHDVDHRGLNNNFHVKAQTPMGILTSLTGQKAVLEVHHATIAVELLSALNLFKNMTQEHRTEAYRLIIDAVLATDMASHKDFCEQFEVELAGRSSTSSGGGGHGGLDLSNPQTRRLLVIMLLKSADISNITKDFDTSRKWGISVMSEFYFQGDHERQMGVEVTPMFDREKRVELARGQLGFIQFMGRPFFLTVAKCLPQLTYLVENIDRNVAQWQRVLESRRDSVAAAKPA